MDAAMLFPMIQQFITPETIRGIANATGEMLSEKGIVLVTAWADDENGTGEDYTPADFVEMIFTAMVEQISGANEPNSVDVTMVGWSE
jgi:hypothetical protein